MLMLLPGMTRSEDSTTFLGCKQGRRYVCSYKSHQAQLKLIPHSVWIKALLQLTLVYTSAYYKVFSGSAICLFHETLQAAGVDQQLTKSHSLDDLSNAPSVQSCIMATGSFSKSSGDVSEAVNKRNKSCSSLSNSLYVQHGAAKTKPPSAGTVQVHL